ncbi:MAG: hypothetical protein HY548_03470, partial [Elusimicrobia bacterium]|nr:hypothetical protein [Elusimicrobiota bacterium]
QNYSLLPVDISTTDVPVNGRLLSFDSTSGGKFKWVDPNAASQWVTNVNDVYYNTGNVGVKTTNPLAALSVGPHSSYTNNSGAFIAGSPTLGGSLDSMVYVGEFRYYSSNANRLLFLGHRVTADPDPTEWMTSAWRIQPAVDNSFTDAGSNRGYIEFNMNAENRLNFSGSGGAPDMVVSSLGRIGIGIPNPDAALHVYPGVPGGIGFHQNANGKFYVDAPSILGGRMTILENGSVGIGTAGPQATLHVSSATATASTTVLRVSSGTSPGQELLTVKGDGKVGIKTASPTAELEVNGTVKAAQFTGQGAIPAGLIAIFTGSCPTGWTRVAAFDGRFLRGAAASGGMGGSSTHVHDVNPLGTTTSSNGGHGHTTDPALTATDAVSNHSHGAGTFAGTTDTAPTHSHGQNGSGKAVDGGTTGLGVAIKNIQTDLNGGHSHAATITGASANAGGQSHNADIGPTLSDTQGSHDHTFNMATFSSEATSTLPSYYDVLFCQKN